jgi:hypothetical protein
MRMEITAFEQSIQRNAKGVQEFAIRFVLGTVWTVTISMFSCLVNCRVKYRASERDRMCTRN